MTSTSSRRRAPTPIPSTPRPTTTSRLATAGYTAPDNAGIADIDAKTESLADIQAKTDLLVITDGLVQSEIQKINGVTLAGSGTEADPMSPA
ncbi:MAG: hypothetical protein E6Q97_24960 [Desulfurellales bacterium]|nr:MAG: hypothetical protein E6Q97_24960 [Desulfurellales bacterium]